MAIIRNSGSTNDKDSSFSSSRKITKKLDLLDQKINGLYRDVYVSRPDNKENLDKILTRLDDAINRIQNDNINVSGISELLRRVEQQDGATVKNLMDSVGELFSDQNLVNSLFANQDVHKYISAQNYQFDMICRYLPKLVDALEIKRDNVLSSDNFSKEFINPKSSRTNKMELERFSSNTTKLEKIYDINRFVDKLYLDTSKYGEQFVYVVPYNIAFQRVIRRTNLRKNTARLGQLMFMESVNGGTPNEVEVCLETNYVESKDFATYRETVLEMVRKTDLPKGFKGSEIKVHFNDTNIITESINERLVLQNKQDLERFQSLSSIFESQSVSEASKNSLMKQYEKLSTTNDGISKAAGDGLIIPDNLNKDPDKIDKNMLGAVVEVLPRENVIPLYIGKVCMGYYYMEFREDPNACGFCGQNHMTPGISNSANYGYEMSEDQQELAMRYIASKLSNCIDTHFINANKDLKEEIYAILRYNEKFDIYRSNDIGVTFIPAEDIIHCYFTFDEEAHRGVSDLQKSVVPSMLYILLYLTDIIGKISRSTDKRIYYVKQNVETNVARTMMNVVQQIKKGNMGMRQIESMNNILNVVGKYNDYIIPMGPSGDPPITFEVMQGQNIETPTDIMEKMLEEAVNGTGVPFEMLNSIYQQDFAIRFSMSNTRFMKGINTRQRDTERFVSMIYTKIYNYEFNENMSYIQIMLPPPIYLTVSNTQQLLDAVTQQADKIVELELVDEEDDMKNEFKKIYIRNILSTYIDFNSIERFKSSARVNIESRKVPQVDTTGGDESSGDSDDYGF